LQAVVDIAVPRKMMSWTLAAVLLCPTLIPQNLVAWVLVKVKVKFPIEFRTRFLTLAPFVVVAPLNQNIAKIVPAIAPEAVVGKV
jgi:hypothetical protein